jgi:carbamoyl-phosphate synthase large subunit
MAKTSTNGAASTTAPAAPALAPRVSTGTILLTGVGGIVGQGILKCLSTTPYRTIGVDASELAVGLYAADRGFLVPRVSDPTYIDRLLDLCKSENVRFLFAGLDMELPLLARMAPRFREHGVIPVVSPPEVIDLADDKLETVRFLLANGFAAPKTIDLATGSARELGFPVVLKPRRGGSRSQGVYLITTESELAYRLTTIPRDNYVAQEYLEGDEYSAGSVTFDGKCHGVMVMRRTMRDGDTHKAFVFRDPAVDAYIARVCETLKPFGPCNFQFRMRRGVPYIFEINPRVSGGACMRTLAGFNEPAMTVEYLDTGAIKPFTVRPVAVFRYWAEMVVEDVRLGETRKAGTVKNNGQKL